MNKRKRNYGIQWIDNNTKDYSELYINGNLIGTVDYYNDEDESKGFYFSYNYGVRGYSTDYNEYFEGVTFEKAKELSLSMVYEHFSIDCVLFKTMCDEILSYRQ